MPERPAIQAKRVPEHELQKWKPVFGKIMLKVQRS